ncbi:MarR family winged helix-turn-helix transcriptional regulator [Kitasatospora purpeofusca]|uniref:MarR family winged helix-turn-helix transcriptional regulator n=1 Tax=Kitasatospora purpeofusca TaxID=67352 RepID=UPI0022588E49|nr:MarR family transcriptional regulator [Kitasatospora purpeofusca]MCX4752162.1 MarR family transcriptional regulator [Kitasatospora purpeofusca]WSR31758.1 MarR family transcriptional regulator [Kitasatospora purpeofusca]WSR39782.1 MarR family transcriptional regulator [Kitasatospora purpeofusca]
MNSPHPETLELAADLRSAIGELVRALRPDDTLPQNQAGVLGLLVRDDRACTVAELAALQRVRHQSMARTVALLTEAGLVTQQPHTTDRRKLLVTATEAGRTALHEQRARREARIAAAIEARLSSDERETLRSAVALLRRLP